MSFTAIDHLDVWPLATSLRSKTGVRDSDRMVLRAAADGGGFIYAPALKEWRAMVAVLKEIRERDWETGGIELVRLQPGASGAWERGSQDWALAVLPIVTNPLAYFFAGVRWLHIEAGCLVAADRTWPASAVNWGKTMHFHLEIECRAKTPSPPRTHASEAREDPA